MARPRPEPTLAGAVTLPEVSDVGSFMPTMFLSVAAKARGGVARYTQITCAPSLLSMKSMALITSLTWGTRSFFSSLNMSIASWQA